MLAKATVDAASANLSGKVLLVGVARTWQHLKSSDAEAVAHSRGLQWKMMFGINGKSLHHCQLQWCHQPEQKHWCVYICTTQGFSWMHRWSGKRWHQSRWDRDSWVAHFVHLTTFLIFWPELTAFMHHDVLWSAWNSHFQAISAANLQMFLTREGQTLNESPPHLSVLQGHLFLQTSTIYGYRSHALAELTILSSVLYWCVRLAQVICQRCPQYKIWTKSEANAKEIRLQPHQFTLEQYPSWIHGQNGRRHLKYPFSSEEKKISSTANALSFPSNDINRFFVAAVLRKLGCWEEGARLLHLCRNKWPWRTKGRMGMLRRVLSSMDLATVCSCATGRPVAPARRGSTSTCLGEGGAWLVVGLPKREAPSTSASRCTLRRRTAKPSTRIPWTRTARQTKSGPACPLTS